MRCDSTGEINKPLLPAEINLGVTCVWREESFAPWSLLFVFFSVWLGNEEISFLVVLNSFRSCFLIATSVDSSSCGALWQHCTVLTTYSRIRSSGNCRKQADFPSSHLSGSDCADYSYLRSSGTSLGSKRGLLLQSNPLKCKEENIFITSSVEAKKNKHE